MFQILSLLILLITVKASYAGATVCYSNGGCHYVATQVADWVWQSRYGALALDQTVGTTIIGTANAERTAEKAEKKALKHCEKQGGKKCEIVRGYYNQCIAVVVTAEKAISAYYGETKKDAKKAALMNCKSDEQCQVVHNACSGAVKVLQGYHYE